MNEGGDHKKSVQVKLMIGEHTRLLTCLALWNGQDPEVIIPAAREEAIGLFGFTEPEPNSLPPSLDFLRGLTLEQLQGDYKNIYYLAEAFLNTKF